MFGLFKKEKVSTKWKWYATAAFLAALVVNGLAGSSTVINGQNTAAISDKYANLFAPAGFTFAIWGLIYLLLIVFLVRIFGQWVTDKPRVPAKVLNSTLKLFTYTSLLNGAWLLAWQYEVLWLSVLLMIGLLVTLIVLHRDLVMHEKSTSEYIAVQLPFSIYLGWISVATIANITTWLVQIGWNGWGLSDSTWTILVLIVGAVIGVTTAIVRLDWAYLAVFVWAYLGILNKHLTFYDGTYWGVILTLAILMPVLVTVCLLTSSTVSRKLATNRR